ncbi:tetratricopeptide repeat protein [Nanoarchaeota archaeon]
MNVEEIIIKKEIEKHSFLLKYDCDNLLSIVSRGSLYTQINEYDKAEEDFLTAMYIDPKTYKNCLDLSRIYVLKNQYNNALNLMNKTINILPTEPQLYKFRSELYKSLNYEYLAEKDWIKFNSYCKN